MTEQTEKDKKFNLEDWVTHRAANQTAFERDETVKQQHQANASSAVSGVITLNAVAATNGATSAPVIRDTPLSVGMNGGNGGNDRQSNASSSSSAPRVPQSEPLKFASALGTASQQIQIVRLLQDLGDRLRASEKEREILWREIESNRKLLNDLDDKTSKSEKAYLSLETKIAAQPDHGKDIDSQKKTVEELMADQKKLLEKLTSLETTAGSTVVRVEDALSENHKLAKRLDQVAQDKIRLQRKLDVMEETLTQTQDALKAKALVLLTDHAIAQRTALPQVQAFTEQDKERLSFLQNNNGNGAQNTAQQNRSSSMANQSSDKSDWWKQGMGMVSSKKYMRTAATIALIALGVVGGYVLSKSSSPSNPSLENMTPVEPKADDQSSVKSQDELMNDIAKMANDIEPGATDSAGATDQTTAAVGENTLQIAPETLDKIHNAEDSSLKNFETMKAKAIKLEKVKPDTLLPATAKEIETRALSGDASAQHDLAALYSAGHNGVQKDYKRAADWFTLAAYNNVANAQYNLGVLKQQGLGIPQDTKGAMDLYRIAATQNHPEAEYNLGIAAIEGIGADYDPAIAAYYFERAASGGIVEAAYNLGLIQENGLLGDSQPDEAVFWYKSASDRGHVESQKALQQLKTSLAMTDADVDRIYTRVAATHPNALGGAKSLASSTEKKAAAKENASKSGLWSKVKSYF